MDRPWRSLVSSSLAEGHEGMDKSSQDLSHREEIRIHFHDVWHISPPPPALPPTGIHLGKTKQAFFFLSVPVDFIFKNKSVK
ncbi:hypothetical protein I7I50_05900 [Histoplasma capsulatum G186AR]|uniref:Uncharacterized protein n=1 Tax=Ajellomyces capsulatus TaxID=5037 RepID=A0A8H7Z7C5_AJECA|nr:hypothetical protein I7I52_04159 [Histoplasma capsulatum]QSS76447.1 hypothetical protein I7I50_05900 [Histoplasma capsulatum G186AR]